MCGRLTIMGHDIWIDCEVNRDWPPSDPGPLIDFTRLKFREDLAGGPQPEPWRMELTRVVQMLDAASRFQDVDVATRLGTMIAEVGTQIARSADIDIQLTWEAHTA
jgi:hypothetical protein